MIFYLLLLCCVGTNSFIFKNSFTPLAIHEFIKSPLKESIYIGHEKTENAIKIVERGIHNVGNAFYDSSYQMFILSEKIYDISHELSHMHNELHEYIKDKEAFMNNINHEIGNTLVKIISSILPHVDTIGHKVLHMDDQIINYFINLDNISPEVKKNIILSIIRISQDGDHFGAQMLQLYYDIVNKLM